MFHVEHFRSEKLEALQNHEDIISLTTELVFRQSAAFDSSMTGSALNYSIPHRAGLIELNPPVPLR
jgi:hypothetical protein